jgi:phage portal protein BeeE
MGLLETFGLRKAAPVRNASDDPGNPGVWRKGAVTIITYADVVNSQEALKHPVIARCVDIIAKAVQSVAWFAEVDPDADAAERVNKARVISALNALLRSPNDRMTGENFRYWMAQNYSLYARVPFAVGVGTSDLANGLYPLNARLVQAVSSSRGLLDHYDYGNGTEDKVSYPIRRNANGKTYVYEIARPNLEGTFISTNRDASNTLLCSIALPAQVITLLLRRAIDTASGHPNTKYVVIAEKTLTNKQKESLAKHVENMAPGQEESGNILFLYNTNAKIEKLDNSLADIHSKMPMDDMTRMIVGAFGIPIALYGLGAADGAKFASNYTESRRAFWADTIIPGFLVPFATGMTAAIAVPGVRIRFDYDTIDALRDHNIGNAQKLERVTFLSIDEKRELVGFEPEGTDETKAVPSPVAAAPAASTEDPPAPPSEDE